MHSHYVFLALEIARERAAEADARRLARLAHPSERVGAHVRRSVARIALAVARAADDEVRQARCPATDRRRRPNTGVAAKRQISEPR